MDRRHFLRFVLVAASFLIFIEPTGARGGSHSDGAPPLPVSGLSGVAFLTADFAPLRRFYGQGAGLDEAPADPDTLRFAVGASQWIEFQRVPAANWPRRLRHVTLEASDLGALEDDLKARGVPTTWIDSNPQRRILQLVDPAGNLIQMTPRWTAPESAGGRSSPFSRHLQHAGLAVAYPLAESTIAFYARTLGFAEAFRIAAPDGRPALVKLRLPGAGQELIELIFFDPPLNKWASGAFDHFNLEVASIDDAYRALHSGGIATQGNHLPTVNAEHLWAIDIIDPELTRMEVQELSPTSAPIGTVSTVGGGSARPLFDGRTLAGWEGNTENWRVEDGAIVAGALDRRQAHNEFLATTADYGDFELRLQYKVEGTGGFVNGGVQFWSQRVPGGFEVSGYQADLGAGTDGNLYDESRRNANLAAAPPGVRDRALRPRAWNDYRIRAEEAHIQIWLNGVKTVDYTEREPGIPRRGKFALQIHGGANTKVYYRNLEIEALP
jgi:hypothetical protein